METVLERRGDTGFLRSWLWNISAQQSNKLTLLHLAFTGSGMQVQGTNMFFSFTKKSIDFSVTQPYFFVPCHAEVKLMLALRIKLTISLDCLST